MHVSTGSLYTPAESSAPLEADRPAASITRRWLAFLVDMAVGTLLGAAGMMAASAFTQVDAANHVTWIVNAASFIGFSYLAWSPALFGNTLGKLVFGLHIAHRHGGQRRPALLAARGVVLVLLMPINALMVVFGGRHLGDLLADVEVVRGERSLLVALPLALAVCALSFQAMFPLLRITVNGASVTWVARQAAGANDELPLAFTLEETTAEFYLASAEGPKHVILRREGGVWRAISVEAVASADVPSEVNIRAGKERSRKERIEAQIQDLVRENYGIQTSYVRCPEEGLIGAVRCRAGLKEGNEVSFPVEISGDRWKVLKGTVLLGKPREAAVSEAVRKEYGLMPDSVTCPGLIEAGVSFFCTASFVAMQHAMVAVTLEVDQEHVESLSSAALFKPRDLEERAQKAWPAASNKVMTPVCLERGYLIPLGGEAQCDTSLENTVAVFRKGPQGLAVSFKSAR